MQVRSSLHAPAPNGATTSAADPELKARFAASLAALGASPATKLALAVSGGGDSVALMMLFADWARDCGARQAPVLIVNHGLRPESAAESVAVADWAGAQGFEAAVLPVLEPPARANIEDWAREARYRAMGAWCRAHQVQALLVAHTREDQAETVLLRLGRGSGVDGLAAMTPRARFPVREFQSLALLRPLLDFGRADLRRWLAANGTPWFEDPMNADARFARTRIRALLPLLEEAGVPAARIAAAARHLARAREALAGQTGAFLAHNAYFGPTGIALLDGGALAAAEREIGLRALSEALMRVSGNPYRPRFERLERLLAAVAAGAFSGRTLAGCRVGRAPKAQARYGPSTLLIARELPRRGAKAEAAPTVPAAPKKPPQKGRNRAV